MKSKTKKNSKWRPQWYPHPEDELPIKQYLLKQGWSMQDLFNRAVGDHLNEQKVKCRVSFRIKL